MTQEIPLTKRREGGEVSAASDAEPRLTAIADEYAKLVHDAIARSDPGAGDCPGTVKLEAEKRLRNVLPTDRRITDLASHIFRLAVTATIDAVRRVKTSREERPAAAVEGAESGMNLSAPGSHKSPEGVVRADEVAQKVREALGFLIESRRRAVGLSLEGFTIREIADLLCWSELKTRNALYRGLKDLRRQLRSLGIDYEIE